MTEIEKRELKGITGSLIKGVIFQTAFIVAGACGFYFTLKSEINELKVRREEESKYIELKFQAIQLQNSTIQKQLDAIQFQIDNVRNQK